MNAMECNQKADVKLDPDRAALQQRLSDPRRHHLCLWRKNRTEGAGVLMKN